MKNNDDTRKAPESVAASLLGSAQPEVLPANATGDEQSSAAFALGGKLTGKDDANRSRPHSAAPCPERDYELEYLEAALLTCFAARRLARQQRQLREACDLSVEIDTLELRIAAHRRKAAATDDSATCGAVAPGPKLPSIVLDDTSKK